MTNGAPMVTAYLAVLRAGMVAVPINPTSTSNEISRVLAGLWLDVSVSRMATPLSRSASAVAETAVLVMVNRR